MDGSEDHFVYDEDNIIDYASDAETDDIRVGRIYPLQKNPDGFFWINPLKKIRRFLEKI